MKLCESVGSAVSGRPIFLFDPFQRGTELGDDLIVIFVQPFRGFQLHLELFRTFRSIGSHRLRRSYQSVFRH